VPPSSRPGSDPGHCRWRCCGPSDPAGCVHSFELREEFATIAKGNIADFFDGEPENWSVTVGDLADTLPQTFGPGSVDRVVLDMLTPWNTLDAVSEALTPGGIVIAYVATVPQLSRFVEALRASGNFAEPESMEAMVRGWHADGLAVRPDHRMIAHTGFLIMARRMAAGVAPLEKKKRPQRPLPQPEDVARGPSSEVTEAAIGTRTAHGKKLRRVMRDAGKRLRTDDGERGCRTRTALHSGGGRNRITLSTAPPGAGGGSMTETRPR
jgi:tRNA (adenine57-N1/adenine58-N1)-methyltransferase